MRFLINYKNWLFALLFILTFANSKGALQDSISKEAFDILDKNLKPIVEESNVAIYFHAIAYGISNPLEIFSLPAYKLFMEGYWIIDGAKFELQLGSMKGLSNGEIFTIINEETGTMYIDSVNKSLLADSSEMPDINTILDENFGKGSLIYLGSEMVNGKECHKIKSGLEKYPDSYSVFWVDKATERIILMADRREDVFDVYWIQKITSAPVSYNFSINLPDKEITTFYGYEVMDMRFSDEFIKKPIGYDDNSIK